MPGLISDQLLDNLRTVAYRQLTTDVEIKRATLTTTDADSKKTWATVTTTTGWLVEKKDGALTVGPDRRAVTEQRYELRLRDGTDILPGDQAVIGGATYYVIDVNSEVTISLLLKAALRRVE